MINKSEIVIIGGGTGGITAAAQLVRCDRYLNITLIEPSQFHYYQPLYTLVGAGADKKEKTQRPMIDLIPKGVHWIQDRVTGFSPDDNTIELESGKQMSYDFLVVAPGLQINWNQIEGLEEAMSMDGISSIYGYEEAERTWLQLKNFQGGKAIFTAPSTPVKCGGAPQKITYLTEALFRKKGIREKSDVIFASGVRKLFPVKGFAETLEQLVIDRNISTLFNHELIKVNGESRQATFLVKKYENRKLVSEEEKVLEFDFLHVVPPMSAPDFVRKSPIAIPDGKGKGWVDVDIYTLQHLRFPNIFAIGDVANLPTGKTGAAIRKQVPVVIQNILSLIDGQSLEQNSTYDGYSACPILTDYHHVLMAEFTYGYQPAPSVKFMDTTKPSYLMYLAKHYYLPWFYWNRMMKGKG